MRSSFPSSPKGPTNGSSPTRTPRQHNPSRHGSPNSLRPTDKLTGGKRLAAAARKIAYGQDVPYSGPTFKSVQIDGPKAVISFDHADGGLASKGDEVKGFQIAGDDKKFVPAKAK